ncbi:MULTISPECIES: hypothetical protein [unclassified Oceanobacillus]
MKLEKNSSLTVKVLEGFFNGIFVRRINAINIFGRLPNADALGYML